MLLQPIIEQAIRRQMGALSTRLAWLLVRVAFDAGQTRSLVTNILGRQAGVSPERQGQHSPDPAEGRVSSSDRANGSELHPKQGRG